MDGDALSGWINTEKNIKDIIFILNLSGKLFNTIVLELDLDAAAAAAAVEVLEAVAEALEDAWVLADEDEDPPMVDNAGRDGGVAVGGSPVNKSNSEIEGGCCFVKTW